MTKKKKLRAEEKRKVHRGDRASGHDKDGSRDEKGSGTGHGSGEQEPFGIRPDGDGAAASDEFGIGLQTHIARDQGPLPVILQFLWMAFMTGALATTGLEYRIFTTFAWTFHAVFHICAFLAQFFRRVERVLLFWAVHLVHGTVWLTAMITPDAQYADRAKVVGLSTSALRLRVYLPIVPMLVYVWYKWNMLCVDFYERVVQFTDVERRCNTVYQILSPVLVLAAWRLLFHPRLAYLTDLPEWPGFKTIATTCFIVNGGLLFLLSRKYRKFRGPVVWFNDKSFFVLYVNPPKRHHQHQAPAPVAADPSQPQPSSSHSTPSSSSAAPNTPSQNTSASNGFPNS